MTPQSPLKTPAPSEALLSSFVSSVAKAQQQLDQASRLVALIGARNAQPKSLALSGYCAIGGVSFNLLTDADGNLLTEEESLRQLVAVLKEYPPVPLVDLVTERTMKPLSAVRDQERSLDALPCAPVLYQGPRSTEASRIRAKTPLEKALESRGTVRWWFEAAGGLVEAQASGQVLSALEQALGAGVLADSHVYSTGSQTAFHRVLKKYDNELLATELLTANAKLIAVHTQWDEFLSTQFAGRPWSRSWARGFFAFSHRNGMPDADRTAYENFPYNLRYKPAKVLHPGELELVRHQVALRIEGEKELSPQIRDLAAAKLQEGKQFLTELLSPFQGARGSQNYNSPSVAVTAAVQQRLGKQVGGGVEVNMLREENGGFSARVQVSTPAAPDGIAFIDFKVTGNPEGKRLMVADLAPEYEDVSYPWEA